ncbi:bifunctional cobalt-precorrin-7 (C(5))-methyltransferase/cobalt-precorrin-6B (C(15))-methyltransferase [Desulfomicrobium baculatum]|uniref:Precorrin-6y C5,15-methyltransferase (Decarboxylating), CbiE subunit n=1 Tax=Desulfomicrobium baculatum (strain DSM 4028 / VKM B-1378 / X) TaxID=525897 RepID=C7LVZ0_DESBD|nr:bifunctional cobalt-precorrin-7 (C(5))-methyltransferase/cobalt-precorrin-6B (C(15))-methyltransferase [Desulfomicrobium baculatum]ACU89808.1 precorrin-6y C5,15-methyltransferase (decarboxylating), CbiE subunit [Desulfomicrobium baculatum DSM 4028]
MIHVLGLGLCPAHRSPETLDLIRSADLVAGGRRLLDELGIEESRRLPLGALEEFAARIQSRAEDGIVCVLADGDPLLYGIGASLLRFFAPRELTFHPNVSALQTACARFGLPWHECRALSLHGRDDQTPLFAALTHGSLAALYTDHLHSPDAIARLLLERGVTGWRMHVAEALGGPEEQLTTVTLPEAAQRSWHTLNIILLERTQAPTLTLELGLDENALAHAGALMTKQPVRAFALSLLRLPPDATLWDLGAGSGAVSLEAARLLDKGRVVAVERQAERVRHIKTNVERTGAWLVKAVHASLEYFLEDGKYAPPTHIFLGGGASEPVLSRCAALLAPGGRLVVAAVLLSTLETARAVFSRLGWPLTVHQLMHHASAPLGGDVRLVPSNPVFLLETQKPSSDT